MPLLEVSPSILSMSSNRKCSLYWTTTVLSILKFSTVIYKDLTHFFNKKSNIKKPAKDPVFQSIEKIPNPLNLRDKTIEEKCKGKRDKDQEKKSIITLKILRKVVKSKNVNDLTDIALIFFIFLQVWILRIRNFLSLLELFEISKSSIHAK